MRLFCEYIYLKCLCLWDFDKVVKFDKEIKDVKKFVEIDVVFKILYGGKYKNEKFLFFIENEDFLKVV